MENSFGWNDTAKLSRFVSLVVIGMLIFSINLLIVSPAYSFLCVPGFGATYQEALDESNITIVAVVSAEPLITKSTTETSYTYTVSEVVTERGIPKDAIRQVTWQKVKVFAEADGTLECPRWWGSGAEQSLAINRAYRMLLKSQEGGSGPFELLWAEMIEKPMPVNASTQS